MTAPRMMSSDLNLEVVTVLIARPISSGFAPSIGTLRPTGNRFLLRKPFMYRRPDGMISKSRLSPLPLKTR